MAEENNPAQQYLRDPDVQLMLRVKDGDEAAFGTLVKRFEDRLLTILTNMIGDASQAEDLCQEVFLRVYRARRGYEPNSKLSTWIFQIAINLANTSRRNSGRRKEVQFTSSASGSQPLQPGEQLIAEKSALMPVRQVDRGELRERIQEAMQSLIDSQRTALLLHKFEELSYEEIGNVMELSSAAVKSLLSRARESLRVALESYVIS